jgi:hypothetical protein
VIAGADYVVELGPGGGAGGGEKIAEGTPRELRSRRTATAKVLSELLRPNKPPNPRASTPTTLEAQSSGG